MGFREDVNKIKALTDENRLAIMLALQHGEKCGCDLLEELNITQPTLSHHMKILCESGIVESRQEGKWTHYQLSSAGRETAIRLLQELITPDSEQPTKCSSCGK